MKQIQAIFLGILLILSSFKCFLMAGPTSEKVVQLHQDIGKELILMRKDNLDLGSKIYPLLDQVGSLYRISCNIIKRKKEIKLALKQEQEIFSKINDENKKLKEKVASLEYALNTKNTQFTIYQQRLSDVMDERNNLLKKTSELDAKEKEYSSRLKELEANHEKAKDQNNSTVQNS